MILTCPTCGTLYQTDRTRLAPPGGNVRCAKCLAVWFHAVTEAEDGVESDSGESDTDEAHSNSNADADAAGKNPAAQNVRAENRTRLALVAGWGALLLFIGAFVWAAIAFRQEIATVWPRSVSFYASINLPVNVRGLGFVDVGFDRVLEDGESMLRVSGRVVNVSEAELAVPEIYVSLRDGDERELYAWTIKMSIAALGPGQSGPFLTRLPNPPPEMRRVDLSFVSGAAP